MYVDISDDLSLSKVEVTVPTTSTSCIFYTLFLLPYILSFNFFFFFKGKISYNLNNSIGIKIVIISNSRAVF